MAILLVCKFHLLPFFVCSTYGHLLILFTWIDKFINEPAKKYSSYFYIGIQFFKNRNQNT